MTGDKLLPLLSLRALTCAVAIMTWFKGNGAHEHLGKVEAFPLPYNPWQQVKETKGQVDQGFASAGAGYLVSVLFCFTGRRSEVK